MGLACGVGAVGGRCAAVTNAAEAVAVRAVAAGASVASEVRVAAAGEGAVSGDRTGVPGVVVTRNSGMRNHQWRFATTPALYT